MHEHYVGIAAARDVESPASAPCNDFNVDAGLLLEQGRINLNNPESSVEVVDATRMDFSCAEASETCARANAIANEISLRRLGMEFLPVGEPSLSGPVLSKIISACTEDAIQIALA
jgi:hypothetical protein